MSKKKMETYETMNFHIAVWLQIKGISLQNIEWNKARRRATFIFEGFDNKDVLIQDFFKQELLQSYISTSQETKARMYAVNPPVEYDRPTEQDSIRNK